MAKPRAYAVKAIEAASMQEMQKQVNDFTEMLEEFQCIDVKFQMELLVEYSHEGTLRMRPIYGALIFYKGIRDDYRKEKKKNAVQKPKAKSVDVRKQAQDGSGVGEGKSENQKITNSKKAPKKKKTYEYAMKF